MTHGAVSKLPHDDPPDASQESGKHLAVALLLAAAIVFGARLLTDHFARPTNTPAAAAKLAVPDATSPDGTAEDEQIIAEARKERQAREQAIQEQDRARREQKKAEILRARDEAAAATQAEEARKDAAWRHYFTQPKKCDSATDDATRVDCSNQYIRAKERFEKLYADGKLR
jgi:hypothetical protein